MSMFSTVVVDGKQIQFKTGGDDCDTYQVGDEVKWWVDPNIVHRGGLLDGVYQGECSRELWWVVIKDHRLVLAVRAVDDDRDEQCRNLQATYNIPAEDPRELWTPAAWEQYDESQELLREEIQRSIAANEDVICYYTRKKMMEPSFMRQILRTDNEPQELQSGDLLLKVGETYRHFNRAVVLDRIYDNGIVSVKHPKGTVRLVSPTELLGVANAGSN